jgi:hypothetical protein
LEFLSKVEVIFCAILAENNLVNARILLVRAAVCGVFGGFAGILDADVTGKIGAARPAVTDTEPLVAVLAPGADNTALT